MNALSLPSFPVPIQSCIALSPARTPAQCSFHTAPSGAMSSSFRPNAFSRVRRKYSAPRVVCTRTVYTIMVWIKGDIIFSSKIARNISWKASVLSGMTLTVDGYVSSRYRAILKDSETTAPVFGSCRTGSVYCDAMSGYSTQTVSYGMPFIFSTSLESTSQRLTNDTEKTRNTRTSP